MASKVTDESEISFADGDVSIESLPDEVLIMILTNNGISCKDILNFGETCKLFNVLVKENQIIWKSQIKTILPQRVGEVISAECTGDWLAEIKGYYNMKIKIFKEVQLLSSKFYKQEAKMTLKDVKVFFKMASSRNINYFIVTSILCEILKVGKRLISSTQPPQRPYDLTDMYYIKIVLRYLFHAYLMIEWILNVKLGTLTAENLIHFIHQWVDTADIHLLEDSRDKLQELADLVEARLDADHPVRSVPQAKRELWRKGYLANNQWDTNDCRKVMATVKYVMYELRGITDKHTYEDTEDALDIAQTIELNTGCSTILAAVFSNLCRRFGVRCDLVTFSDHMFLEWKEDYDDTKTEMYTINLTNGDLEHKRECPFSQASERRNTYQYSAENLLAHLNETFIRSMGSIKNWCTENLFRLHDFLRSNYSVDEQKPYKNYWLFLIKIDEKDAEIPLSYKNMHSNYLDMISVLVNMHRNDSKKHKIIPKPHDRRVRFAVGMICMHTKYNYVCVIKGWDTECTMSKEWQKRMAVNALRFGAKQPFYHIIVPDYSERYVAQEQLRIVVLPNRMLHIEELLLAQEFSYFDGYAYIPNEMKQREYPEDGPIKEMYKNRNAQK